MKKVFLLVLAIGICYTSNAQTEPDTSWKKGGFIGLNFNQVNLSQWAPGGENSISLAGNFNVFANYAKGITEWANTMDLAYAMVKSGSDGLRKNDDKIEINSKYGRKFSEKWLYSFLLNFKSQFAKGYKYPDDSTVISDFFSPAFITVALGATYKPVPYFEVFISPVTGKFTVVTNSDLSAIGAYGVDTGGTVRSELGAYLQMIFKKDIMENVTFSTKLELFNNYTDENKDNAKNIDVNWDCNLNMKINDFLTASIMTQVVYDSNIIERTQFKEMLGIGLGYKF
jgi:hypothetical protein